MTASAFMLLTGLWMIVFIYFLSTGAAACRFCGSNENIVLCVREWMKALSPIISIIAIVSAGYFAFVNLSEVQRSTNIRSSELLRKQLSALEEELYHIQTITRNINLDKSIIEQVRSIDFDRFSKDKNLKSKLTQESNALTEVLQFLSAELRNPDVALDSSLRNNLFKATIETILRISNVNTGPRNDYSHDMWLNDLKEIDKNFDEFNQSFFLYQSDVQNYIANLRDQIVDLELSAVKER